VDTIDLTALPVSSVPAAFDREHLYSPTSDVAAYGIDYRAGDLFEPMPDAPRGNPKAWSEWWRTVANVETPDFLGLKAGDEITIQWADGVTLPGKVVTTYRWAALARYPLASGSEPSHAEMYVTHRNQFGNWYR
jgi:hypothetical protein